MRRRCAAWRSSPPLKVAGVFYVTFGDHDAYPTLIEKAAVLVEHLARNHPLPDGNKRCAFLAVERFLAANGRPITDADPDTDVPMVEKIAAGEAAPNEIVVWLTLRTT